MTTPRHVLLVGFDGVQSLDLTGPLEVFETAARLVPGSYTTEVVSMGGKPFATGSGLRISPAAGLAAHDGKVDTLIVPGGTGARASAGDERLVAAIRSTAGRSRRVASVCTGAFLLAATGLLDGRRATTHWSWAAQLTERYPLVEVDPDAIFVQDGRVWTSAGVTAGIDLALAMVEEDNGREAALAVARWLVVFATRPGGQSQFSAALAAQLAEQQPIRAAQELARTQPEQSLTVEVLAEHACMSVRGFARAFRREVGTTPAAYVEAVRVERATQLLQTTNADLDRVARDCGFGTVETLRRAFRRQLSVSPSQYRERFRGARAGAA